MINYREVRNGFSVELGLDKETNLPCASVTILKSVVGV